jgi:hypothetical protein
MTFAYWNPDLLGQSRLLNVQTGEYLDVQVRALGEEPHHATRAALYPSRRAISVSTCGIRQAKNGWRSNHAPTADEKSAT